jgi:transposase
MSRGKPAPAIRMTERQYRLLSQHGAKHSLSHHTKTRIRILVLASEGRTNASVKRELGIDLKTVKKWRRRWEAEFDSIKAFELGESGQGVSDKELLKKMLLVLKDDARSGAPKRITLAQEKQIIALACEKPEDHGIPITQWTQEMLAHVAKAKGIVETISPRYVGEILKKKRASTA